MINVLNVIAESERVLWDLLSLALQRRNTPAATLPILAAYSGMPDLTLVFVVDQNRVYRYAKDSQAVPNGLTVVAPATAPVAGRWLRMDSPLTFGPNTNRPVHAQQTGICHLVEVYQGDDGFEQMLERGYGQPPFVLIEYVGDEVAPLSLRPGGAYQAKIEFAIHCFSRCHRPPWAALWGSAYAPEALQDPGVFALLSLVRYLCAGVATGVDGVQKIEIGRADVEYEDLGERLFSGSLQVFVHASFEIPDEDLVALDLCAQPMEPAAPADVAPFDAQNYVSQGLFVDPGAGLARTIPDGLAVINGLTVFAPGVLHTFPATSDIYRDLLPSGVLVFSVVGTFAPAPIVPAGALRIARTRTDSTDVLSDTWLCGHAFPLGDPMQIVPA